MNKEITIYELLGLIKDGQAPKKIKYKGIIYEYIFQNGYTHKDEFSSQYYFVSDFCADYEKDLNDKVEIIEEDNKTEYENVEEINYVGCKVEINIIGIKELFNTDSPVVTEHCIDKINQLIRNQKKLIDEVNKLKEKK